MRTVQDEPTCTRGVPLADLREAVHSQPRLQVPQLRSHVILHAQCLRLLADGIDLCQTARPACGACKPCSRATMPISSTVHLMSPQPGVGQPGLEPRGSGGQARPPPPAAPGSGAPRRRASDGPARLPRGRSAPCAAYMRMRIVDPSNAALFKYDTMSVHRCLTALRGRMHRGCSGWVLISQTSIDSSLVSEIKP